MDKLGNYIYNTLPPEDDYGDVEYKWSLASMNDYKRSKITSQMKWRILEESEHQSVLYILGIHDNGDLTGLPRSDLIATYVNLMDCAQSIDMFTCLRKFERLGDSKYWAVMQVFKRPPCSVKCDQDLPDVPYHNLPEYIP